VAGNALTLELYEKMQRCMVWEQRLLRMIDEGLVSGFFHAGRGQEGAQIGAVAAMKPGDYLLYAHRGCGYMVARGMPMDTLFADFIGNIEGSTRGLGAGIVHIAWPELGILGQSGTVGGCFPIAAGAALSARYRGTDQVTLCFFGDGTANRGTFHEAANAAGVWKLPVVWFCENNGWAVSTSFENSSSVKRISDRGAAYGMPGVTVDGQDVLAVHQVTLEAIERARRGDGPTLIEAITQRFRGHFEGDPDNYRDRADLDELRRQRDPILLLAKRILDAGEAREDALRRIDQRIAAEVEAAAVEALKGHKPGRERIFEFVYA
jgi:acetoin:2,6-dichlorophenolindophenol oxidoreductase subunit alpha